MVIHIDHEMLIMGSIGHYRIPQIHCHLDEQCVGRLSECGALIESHEPLWQHRDPVDSHSRVTSLINLPYPHPSRKPSLRACIVVKHGMLLACSTPFSALVPHTLSVAHKHSMYLVCSFPFSNPDRDHLQIPFCSWQRNIVLIPNGSSWWMQASMNVCARCSGEMNQSTLAFALLLALSWLCILTSSQGWCGLGSTDMRRMWYCLWQYTSHRYVAASAMLRSHRLIPTLLLQGTRLDAL